MKHPTTGARAVIGGKMSHKMHLPQVSTSGGKTGCAPCPVSDASVPKFTGEASRGQASQLPPTESNMLPQRKQLAGMK